MSRLAVIGLGKLGACTAAAFAAGGHEVIGVDRSKPILDALRAGKAPVVEPGLQTLLDSAGSNLEVTESIVDAVRDADFTFVIVPTPSEADGRFSLKFVQEAVREIGQGLRGQAKKHVVVITSTVLPGSLEHAVKPLLEQFSGRTCGDDLGLCYNPEFIALGSVIQDFLEPDLLLIGESAPWAGIALAEVYRPVCRNRPKIARMSFASAELTKIALNTFVTTKISFANMLAELCEDLPGANVDDVCAALGEDRRIGRHYLRGGLGYGGPCFPRDNVALASLARELGCPAGIPQATDATNHRVVDRLVGLVESRLPRGSRLTVVGVAYKPGTGIIERSHGLELAERLVKSGYHIEVFDRAAGASAEQASGGRLRAVSDLSASVAGADGVVLATRDAAAAAELLQALQSDLPLRLIVDCWRQIDPREIQSQAEVVALGVGKPQVERVQKLQALWAGA